MRSSTSRPTGLSASAVTIAVSNPKQRRNPRATLYSPPPSHTRKWRVVETRPSPGSSRSITSPRLTRSHWHCSFGFMFSFGMKIAAQLHAARTTQTRRAGIRIDFFLIAAILNDLQPLPLKFDLHSSEWNRWLCESANRIVGIAFPNLPPRVPFCYNETNKRLLRRRQLCWGKRKLRQAPPSCPFLRYGHSTDFVGSVVVDYKTHGP